MFYLDKKNEKNIILYITDATAKGRGDVDYLLRLTDKKYLIKHHLSTNIKRVAYIPEENDTLLNRDRNGNIISTKLDHIKNLIVIVYRIQNKRQREDELSKIITNEEFKNIKGIIAISSVGAAIVAESLRKNFFQKFPPVIFIAGQGESTLVLNNIKKLMPVFQIGMNEGYYMPEPIISPNDLNAKINLFQTLDLNYQAKLIGTTHINDQSIYDFIKNTLFIPGYLHHPSLAIIFINSIAQSNLAAEFVDGIILHLSLHEKVKTIFSSPENIFNQLNKIL